MKTERVRFYIDPHSFGVQAMVILMAMSVVFRIIGCWGMWIDRSYALSQIALPVVSALLLVACVLLLGRRVLWMSFIPVLLGTIFFIVKAVGFESKIHMVLCILFYATVIVVYFCTVFGMIRTKWILVLLFGLPFLYHVFVEDLPALRGTASPVSFSAGMQEMSVLCIVLGLFFLSLSMKKLVREPAVRHIGRKRRKGIDPARSEDHNIDTAIGEMDKEHPEKTEQSGVMVDEKGSKPDPATEHAGPSASSAESWYREAENVDNLGMGL